MSRTNIPGSRNTHALALLTGLRKARAKDVPVSRATQGRPPNPDDIESTNLVLNSQAGAASISKGGTDRKIARLKRDRPDLDTYLRDAKKDEKDAQKAKAWDLWLDCHESAEIARVLEKDDQTISKWVREKTEESGNSPPDSRQHFDVWSFSNGGDSSFFGHMPPGVVENLLWFYTEAGDIVVDPFAGGGTTIDVSKAMGRRVWSSDLTPSTPTLPSSRHG